jgi:membrane protein
MGGERRVPLPGRDIGWKGFLIALKRAWEEDNVGDVARALTFSGVLAIFPFLLFVVALASLILDPALATAITDQLYEVAPAAVADILGSRLQALSRGAPPGLLTLSGAGAVWAASGGVAALMRALNTAYNARESRPWWKVRAIALLTTVAGAILSIVAALVVVATPALADALGGGPVAELFVWLRLPVAAGLMILVLALLYHLLPDVRLPFRLITPGSVVAVVIWLAASVGFSIYVANFGSYEITYGALGGVIVLLVWMWISAQAILLGAEINAVLWSAAQGEAAPAEAEPRR